MPTVSTARTTAASAVLVAIAAQAGVAHPVYAQARAVAQPGAIALKREQVDALLAAPNTVTFIDVRRADEIAAIGGLPAYLNIQNSELDRFLPYIPRDRQIVTISNHAHRAETAAALLRSRGFQVAGAVGVQDYEVQGGTL